MDKKIKRKDILSLYDALNKTGKYIGPKFSYAVAKNIRLLKNEIESIQKAFEATEDYQAYESERMKLAKAHAKKDEKGKEITEVQNKVEVFVMEDKEKFDIEFKDLQEKYKEVINARKKQIEEGDKLLDEEVKIDLFLIKLEDMPQDVSTEVTNGLFEIIEE